MSSFGISFSRTCMDHSNPNNTQNFLDNCIFARGEDAVKNLKKEHPNMVCEEVPLDQMAQKIKSYMASWGTDGLSQNQIQQEWTLWKHFLCKKKGGYALSRLSFYREDPNVRYTLNFLDWNTNSVSQIFRKIFDNENVLSFDVTEDASEILDVAQKSENEWLVKEQALKEDGSIVREKVYVDSQDCISQSLQFPSKKNTFITNEPVRIFVENNIPVCREIILDPLTVYHFAYTPTLSKISQVAAMGVVTLQQTLTS